MPSHLSTGGGEEDLSRRVQELENELTAGRRREDAIAEILRVIGRSPADLRSVFNAIAKSATQLCDAEDASIFQRDGDQLFLVAGYGPISFAQVGEFSLPVVPGTVNGRSVLEARTVHVADLQSEDAEYPEGSETARKFGHRTTLAVPLLREGVAIGSISLRRTKTQLFTGPQVALLQTFAAQAVIAIPRSAPVGQRTRPLVRGFIVGRAVLDRQTIHLADAQSETSEYPEGSAIAKNLGFRTNLTVPLLGAGEAIGAITLRRSEVRPFTDRQIELLQTFADQAVIAIENARLFEEVQARTRELQESLEYQTATSDVLGVISHSPSQVQPVLDTIVATARRLCEADRATIMRLQDGKYRFAARDGRLALEFEKRLGDHPIAPGDRGTIAGRVALAKRTVHIEDVRQDPEYTAFTGFPDDPRRTLLGVPLLRDDEVIGVIVLSRFEVGPFSRRQIDLVTTFADQAVIAIENARLFDEVQARTRAVQAERWRVCVGQHRRNGDGGNGVASGH